MTILQNLVTRKPPTRKGARDPYETYGWLIYLAMLAPVCATAKPLEPGAVVELLEKQRQTATAAR